MAYIGHATYKNDIIFPQNEKFSFWRAPTHRTSRDMILRTVGLVLTIC
jgi:hypothetical protein